MPNYTVGGYTFSSDSTIGFSANPSGTITGEAEFATRLAAVDLTSFAFYAGVNNSHVTYTKSFSYNSGNEVLSISATFRQSDSAPELTGWNLAVNYFTTSPSSDWAYAYGVLATQSGSLTFPFTWTLAGITTMAWNADLTYTGTLAPLVYPQDYVIQKIGLADAFDS